MPKIVQAGIRMKLLAYAAGVALPLAFVGLVSVWAMSEATRHQLEDSIKKQAEITAVAFKQWLEAQRTPLAAVAAYVDEPPAGVDLPSTLALILKTRSQWAGLLVLNPAGETRLSQPRTSPSPSTEAARRILTRLRDEEWVVDV